MTKLAADERKGKEDETLEIPLQKREYPKKKKSVRVSPSF
jgi:hypothetical protein